MPQAKQLHPSQAAQTAKGCGKKDSMQMRVLGATDARLEAVDGADIHQLPCL